ncbi:MAG: hypothetical protein R6U94_06500 [Nitriliruptoraceae bacterium]
MTSRPPHPTSGPHRALIGAYLVDLEHALSGLDAAERDDVVGSVREHIDTALSEYDREPTVHEVEALLGQLGSVDQTARDADDGTDRSDRVTPDAGSRDGWILVALAGLSLVLFWFPLVSVPLALGAGIAAAISLRGARDPAKRRYRIAITLSVATVLILFLLGLGLVAGGSSTGPVSEPIESEPIPAG